jgi:3-oxoacyl-[acyl-carrier protein] reductase
MQIDLNGKVAIITGAGRGIGREIARTFAREGAMTVPTDVSPSALEDLAREWVDNGWLGRPLACDVRDLEAARRTVETVVAEFGPPRHPGEQCRPRQRGHRPARQDLRRRPARRRVGPHQDVNLKGTFLMCKAVIPTMKQQRSGRILNAASFAAIVPSLGGAAYASSKSGVVTLTRILAGELGPYNITANCYAPGMIPTEMNHFAEKPPKRSSAC